MSVTTECATSHMKRTLDETEVLPTTSTNTQPSPSKLQSNNTLTSIHTSCVKLNANEKCLITNQSSDTMSCINSVASAQQLQDQFGLQKQTNIRNQKKNIEEQNLIRPIQKQEQQQCSQKIGSVGRTTRNVDDCTKGVTAVHVPRSLVVSGKDKIKNTVTIKEETDTEKSKTSTTNTNKDDNAIPECNEALIFAKPHPVLLSTVNPHIICNLCDGYLIDATTIVECLHSFCHSCLIKHLRAKQYCPRCDVMINTAKPNIKPDTTLQAIVYKLVPGLYERELVRKRAFYKDRPNDAALATPEQRGEDTEHLIFSPSDYMSLSLEYADMEEHIGSNTDYKELLKPRYLQCPAMYTVAHLKKFVYGKFDIDMDKFNIDIMYKVKTIVLLNHYTLMDVAYIYTWKRDAPMRFYFRVKESLKPITRTNKAAPSMLKKESLSDEEESKLCNAMTVIHEATPSISNSNDSKIMLLSEIKIETDVEMATSARNIQEPCGIENSKHTDNVNNLATESNSLEVVHRTKSDSVPSLNTKDHQTNVDALKITIVNRNNIKEKEIADEPRSSNSYVIENKEKKEPRSFISGENKAERKVENIKLKIDLSKQNSVTIINMSDPQRKEITKLVKPDKEWKVKNRKDRESNAKPASSNERGRVDPSPLTVPPLTIKAERISPTVKQNSKFPDLMSSKVTSEEEKKSQFLKSFALTPTKTIKQESAEDPIPFSLVSTSNISKLSVNNSKELSKLSTFLLKNTLPSKRKSKEPVKTIIKKPKTSPPLLANNFKIKLPSTTYSHIQGMNSVTPPITATTTEAAAEKPLMPPPATLPFMKPPLLPSKKTQKTATKCAAPGSLTPHPMHSGIQLAAPGNRTPIAKRYHPILPKSSRPNPFADIPCDVNKILKDAGTEIKSITSDTNFSTVYGPKSEILSMGPPPPPTTPKSQHSTTQNTVNRSNTAATNLHKFSGSGSKSTNSNKAGNSNNYLNMALFNASKSKGNEVPPGCRTPMYSPNSPIYSPSSPQYVPNYNIPTVPTYKYTPKPTGANNSYLQSVLGTNSQIANLFPTPPTKKDSCSTQSSNSKANTHPKRLSSFARSPSPGEDPPEKQLKVKSLLTSCNINIPSSLSITITREDSESQSNNSNYPKHKSPVNNYIEILKLPDHPAENGEGNKRMSPPHQKQSSVPVIMPSTQKESMDLKSMGVSQILTSPKLGTSQIHNTKLKPPQSPLPSSNITKSTVNTQNTTKNNQSNTVTSLSNTNLSNCQPNSQKVNKNESIPKTMPPPTPLQQKSSKISELTPSQSSSVTANKADKKTPSPEKKTPVHLSSPTTEKSPKSPNTSTDATNAAQSGKKFRHILPRQNPISQDTNPIPKVQSGNLISTYISNNAVAKVQMNKKVPPTKKLSPVGFEQMTRSQGQMEANSVPQKSLSKHSVKSTGASSKSSPVAMSSNNDTKSITAKTPPHSPPSISPNSICKSVVGHPALSPMSSISHPMQTISGISSLSPHLGSVSAGGNPSSQTELSKFFKENLLRAQAQAAAVTPSNMFYSYASAAAAQMNPYATSTMYNYQQAYIMEQLSRMQRVGNVAFTEYMQKLKQGIDKASTSTNISTNEKPSLAPSSSSSLSPPAKSIESKGNSAAKSK